MRRNLSIIWLQSDNMLLSVMALKFKLETMGSEVVFLIKPASETILKDSGFNHLTDYVLKLDASNLAAYSSIKFFAWFHSSALNVLDNKLSEILEIIPPDKVGVYLYPDGFVNIFRSKNLVNDFSSLIEGHDVKVEGVVQFFEVNNTTAATIASFNTVNQTKFEYVVVDKDSYQKALNYLSGKTKLLDVALDAVKKTINKVVIFIPIRPWCSDFHGGSYKFGNGAKTLAQIYINLIEVVLNLSRDDIALFIKTDSRYLGFQNEVLEELSARYEMIDVSDWVDKRYTSEVLVSKIYERHVLSELVYCLTLDSSTPVSFLASDFNMEYIVGASFDFLRNHGAGPANLNYINSLIDRNNQICSEVCESITIKKIAEGVYSYRLRN